MCGSDIKEISVWPYRIVFWSNFWGSVFTLMFLSDERMYDLYRLHATNIILQCVWWTFFLTCSCKTPSYVRVSDSDIQEYDRCLNVIGQAVTEDGLPRLCHTCHIRRPIRSKHCKVQKRCIHKFDHYCPFVYNTVCRDNYRYFVGTIFMYVVCAVFWEITAAYYVNRVTVTWWFLGFMAYVMIWTFLMCGLLHYHFQLLTVNLTTNEHIGMTKYAYMRNAQGMIDNPFQTRYWCTNIYNGLFPSDASYYTREELTGELLTEDPASASATVGAGGAV